MANVELQQIGPYSITRLLSNSSTISFYLGKLPQRKKDVLIQVLHTSFATPETREAFLARFRQLKRLRHRNLVEVQDANMMQDAVGHDYGYLVMEYIVGETLRQHIAPGTMMAPDEVKRLLTPIADALHYAHTNGVVHGNLHPGNLLKSARNDLYLTNFSLALPGLMAPDEEAAMLPYMAPEHLQGTTTAASDQYSLAIMAYEWLCGQRPYTATNRKELLHQQTHEPIPMSRSLNDAISPTVERVLLHALAPEPAERFQSVYSFSNTYLHALMGLPIDDMKATRIITPSSPVSPILQAKVNISATTIGKMNEPSKELKQTLPRSKTEQNRGEVQLTTRLSPTPTDDNKAFNNKDEAITTFTSAKSNNEKDAGVSKKDYTSAPVTPSSDTTDSKRLVPDYLLNQHYRILKQIGRGGYGAVYKAEDIQLENEPVAIKEMLEEGLSQKEIIEATNAFKKEAVLLRKLDHSSIPQIYEFFPEGNKWYIVMRFIDGETLEQYLNKMDVGGLQIKEVLDIATQLCDVLNYLHTLQPPIIFRDLKPSNIMRKADDKRIYLIDFGIARHFKHGQAKDTTPLGTLGYAPLEQLGHGQTDAKSDIYSLGATLHQLLTGHEPSNNPLYFVPLQLGKHPASVRLATLIQRMLSRDRDERPASMAVIKQELEEIADEFFANHTDIASRKLILHPSNTAANDGAINDAPTEVMPTIQINGNSGTQPPPKRKLPLFSQVSSLRETVIADLEQGGELSKSLPGYEERPAQVEMATQVAESLTDDVPAIIEASTGTGKSYAYLIPIVRSGKVAIISTANKALQEQLFYKDIPFVQQHIKDFGAALVKGMGNYVCLDRLESERNGMQFYTKNPEFMRLLNLTEDPDSTFTGDFETIGFPLPGEIRGRVSADGDQCAWSKCSFFSDCYVRKMRTKAEQAQVIVVNHTLLLLDAAMDGFLLPERDVIIIDEAHHLEEEASRSFTITISPTQINSLLAQHLLKEHSTPSLQFEVDKAMNETWERLRFMPDIHFKGRVNLQEPLEEGLHLSSAIAKLGDSLRKERPKDLPEKESTLYDKLLKRTQNLADNVRIVFSVDQPNKFVYYVERENAPVQRGGYQLQVSAAPLDVTTWLRERLFDKCNVICTSATLATIGASSNAYKVESKGANFAYFRSRVGLDPANYPEVLESILPLTFDYESNALLYIPRHLPEPAYGESRAAENYALEIAREMYRLVKSSRGRAFLLFSSKRMLDKAYELMSPHLEFPLLRQGDMSRIELTRRFREEEGAVLFGLKSFWEGVDIAGDALSLVVIDKLPFEPPDDPVHEARVAQMKAAGENWFGTYVLPQAVLRLKQGLGRLLRTREDRGVMAILDTRLHTKGYGKQVLNALPPARRTSSIKDVEQFFTV